MTTAVGSQPSATTTPPAQTSTGSGGGSVTATSVRTQSTSSLDTPAVTEPPPRDFAAEARQIARNFEQANRSGRDYQRFEPPVRTFINEAGETVNVPVDPQQAARDAVRNFEQSQRDRESRARSQQPESPAQRLLSVERQNVDVLVAERATANALSSLANTLSIAQSNATAFYEDFRASNGVRTTGSLFSRNA